MITLNTSLLHQTYTIPNRVLAKGGVARQGDSYDLLLAGEVRTNIVFKKI